MRDLFHSTTFMLLLTIGSYFLGVFAHKRLKLVIFHPAIVSLFLIIFTLMFLDVDYEVYVEGSRFIHYMLGPAVVSLGYLLYQEVEQIRGKEASILLSITIGSFLSVLLITLLGKLMGIDQAVIASLQPKSVTTPIALSLSQKWGGIESLTAIAVVVTGIFGGLIAPYVLNWVRVNSPIAKGVAAGASAHGFGTACAMQMGAVEGAVAGLSIGLAGIITSLIIPFVNLLFGY